MEKKEAFNILHRCVELYDRNLKNNNIMFVIENKKSPYYRIKVIFYHFIALYYIFLVYCLFPQNDFLEYLEKHLLFLGQIVILSIFEFLR